MNKMNLLKNFKHKEKCINLYKNRKKFKLFEDLTKNSLNIFFRGGDTISIRPQIEGKHEPILTEFVNFASSKGYSDFLIDIGANIGLTSCQSGRFFKEVHMFEPNPHCFKILEVNTFFSLNDKKYKLYKFGLGDINKRVRLMIPKKNWGGAFLRDKINTYSDDILAKKDGFKRIDKKNYHNIDVNIKKASIELKKIFKVKRKKQASAGLIKIDVEGYENVILQGIAEAITSDLKIIIVFENHDPNFNIAKCLAIFNSRAKLYKFDIKYPAWERFSRVFRYLSILFNMETIYRLKIAEEIKAKEDLVLIVN